MTSTATSTVTKPLDKATITVPKFFGNYKEQAAGAQSYNKALEEHGDVDHPKAKVYLPCYVELTVLTVSDSTPTIYQHGM